jgi:cellobiose PTS system EIIC component
MLNSKEPGYRKISRVSLPTQVFGINEPIFFGFLIVLNPIFMIPCVLNALILTTGSFLLMDWGVIQKPFVGVPWTTPPILGHYLVSINSMPGLRKRMRLDLYSLPSACLKAFLLTPNF